MSKGWRWTSVLATIVLVVAITIGASFAALL